MKSYLLVFILFIVVHSSFGKVYEQCDLFFGLYNRKVPDVLKFMCILERAGNRDTTTITRSRGGLNLGIFQIPDKYCRYGQKGGLCNIDCLDLLDEDFLTSLPCALKIHETYGFEGWRVWNKFCKGVQHTVGCD